MVGLLQAGSAPIAKDSKAPAELPINTLDTSLSATYTYGGDLFRPQGGGTDSTVNHLLGISRELRRMEELRGIGADAMAAGERIASHLFQPQAAGNTANTQERLLSEIAQHVGGQNLGTRSIDESIGPKQVAQERSTSRVLDLVDSALQYAKAIEGLEKAGLYDSKAEPGKQLQGLRTFLSAGTSVDDILVMSPEERGRFIEQAEAAKTFLELKTGKVRSMKIGS